MANKNTNLLGLAEKLGKKSLAKEKTRREGIKEEKRREPDLYQEVNSLVNEYENLSEKELLLRQRKNQRKIIMDCLEMLVQHPKIQKKLRDPNINRIDLISNLRYEDDKIKLFLDKTSDPKGYGVGLEVKDGEKIFPYDGHGKITVRQYGGMGGSYTSEEIYDIEKIIQNKDKLNTFITSIKKTLEKL